MWMVTRLALTAFLAPLIHVSFLQSASSQEYYRNKRVSMIVGLAAGGGVDIMARIFAKHLVKNLEGAPTLIVQNMPGAAGATAMNFIAQRAPKDGTTIIYDSWTPLEQIIKSPHITYDYTKMTYIGGLRGGPWMLFARKSVVPGGLKQSVDIAKAAGLVYGGQQPSLILDIHGRLSLNMLGIEYKYVHGYQGAANIRTAMERDEVHITTHGLQGYRAGVEPTLIKSGVAMPLWYFERRDEHGRYVRSPLVTDMPTFNEVYTHLRGSDRSGIQWQALDLLSDLYGASNFLLGPQGMDVTATASLRRAMVITMNDPEFIAEQNKVFGFPHEYVSLPEIQNMLSKIGDVSPELVEFFQKLMK